MAEKFSATGDAGRPIPQGIGGFVARPHVFAVLALALALGACAETRRHPGKGTAQNADGEAEAGPKKPPKAHEVEEPGAETPPDAEVEDEPSDPEPEVPPREPCRLEEPATFELQTIEDVIELVNQLPMPVTLPCLLDVLPRPLRIVATTSGVSIQPALDAENPRVFALSGRLVLAVVPLGRDASLLELSEILSSSRSIKGEIEFPVDAPLDADAAYRHTDMFDGSPGTRCAFCHGGETLRSDGRYESRALRPVPASVIPYPEVLDLHQACAKDPSPRCEILNALFGTQPGDAAEGKFPADMPTIF